MRGDHNRTISLKVHLYLCYYAWQCVDQSNATSKSMFRKNLWTVGRGALSMSTQRKQVFTRMPCRGTDLTSQGTRLAAEGDFFAFFWMLLSSLEPLRFCIVKTIGSKANEDAVRTKCACYLDCNAITEIVCIAKIAS